MSDDNTPTEETLGSGQVVTVHPDGRKVLKSTPTSVRTRLAAAQPAAAAAQVTLREQLTERLHQAQESLAAGDEVPAEKRFV